MTKLTTILLASTCWLAGCATAPEGTDTDEDTADSHPDWSVQYAATCPSGYHLHYVDWSSTRVDALNSCPATGILLHYGDPFCVAIPELQGNNCEGERTVLGRLGGSDGAFEYIKLAALDGH